jgi:WD40 repeat protein
MGYHQAGEVLAKESGYTLASRAARDFEAAILGGRWAEANALLSAVGISPAEDVAISTPEAGSSRNSIASGKTKATTHEQPTDRAKFLIARQKYLEFLEAGQQKKALGVLRNELAACAADSESLHDLSGYMMCSVNDDLYERAKWDGAAGISRRQLLERLQEHISPKIMVPQRRLATLLDQARQHQQLTCLFHDDNEPISLYTDHVCVSGTFPSVTTHVLMDHKDEVWRIEWSPDGNLLASASKDKTVVIWQLKPPSAGNGHQYSISFLHHLKGHRGAVDAMAWSPDSETLVTASDKQIYIWDVKEGRRSDVTIDNSPHKDEISAVQWLPDGSQFVVCSLDPRVVFYDLSGTITRNWSLGHMQLRDIVITPDCSRIVAATTWLRRVPVQNQLTQSSSQRPEVDVTHTRRNDDPFEYGNMDRGVVVIRIEDHEVIDFTSDTKQVDVTSVKLSHDGKSVLVSCMPDELQLYSLEGRLQLTRKFVGHVHARYQIKSCFGAPKDRFVLSGSEDGHVYVWQNNNTTPIEVLSGHTGSVNAVAWNPVLSRKLFASCSDDRTIRLWQPPLSESEAAAVSDGDEGMEL